MNATPWRACLRAMAVVVGAATCVVLPTTAQAEVLQSFDRLFVGDDPSEVFEFPLALDPSAPSDFRFRGFVENFDLRNETGVRFNLRWPAPGGGTGGVDFPLLPDYLTGVRLPPADTGLGPVPIAVEFHADLTFSPSFVQLAVEGLGGDDNFRLVGDFSVQSVPEPGTLTQCGVAAMVLIACWRRRCGRFASRRNQ